MTSQQIARFVSDRFGPRILASMPNDKHPRVHVDAGHWLELATFLHGEPSLKFDWLQCLSGIDYVADGKLCVCYDLWSFDHRHSLAVKAFCPREDPRLPSVAHLWTAADWQEREAYDMFGIVFDGHPDLRRILMPDDYVGWPQRRDFPVGGEPVMFTVNDHRGTDYTQ